MVNTQYLEDLIAESGKSKTFIAKKLGVSRQTLLNKINNVTEFTMQEANLFSEEVGIKTISEQKKAFFCDKST